MVMVVFKQWWDEVFTFKYRNEVGIAIACVIASGLSLYAYHMYKASQDAKAYKAFAESYAIYESAIAASLSQEPLAKKNSAWEEVEIAFDSGYKQNSSSTLAPYFLAFQAESLVQLDRKKEAIEILNTMLKKIPNTSSLYGVYATKKALLLLDIDEQQGIKDLVQQSSNSNNTVQDEALYYAGLYYWNHNDLNSARLSWQKIIELGKQGKNAFPSPWQELAQAKLAQI